MAPAEVAPGPAVALRALGRADLPRLRDWLNEPHVAAWWGRGVTSDGLGGAGPLAATLEEVTERYGPVADGTATTHGLVILADDAPVGMIQWYRLSDEPDYAAAIGEPAGAGLDLLIGDPAWVGRGVGPCAISTLVEVLWSQGVTRCVAGPDVRNRRSVRAFAKAGFRWARDASVPGEPAPEHVMARAAPPR